MKRPEWTRRQAKTQRPAAATATPMGDWAKRMHGLTILLMGAGVIAATAVGFAQSWAGLYGWGVEHGLNEWKATSFPAMVDTFIGIGELGLFALALEGHRLRQSLGVADLLLPLSLASAGWAASLAFNVGHVHGAWTDQLTAGVPPVASMLGLFVLLRTLHRLVARTAPAFQPPQTSPSAAADGGEDPTAADLPDGTETRQSEDQVADDLTAGQPLVVDLRTAAIAATQNLGSQRQAARALGISRDKLRALLSQPATEGSDQPDDDADGHGDAPAESGREEHPQRQEILDTFELDPAKVDRILRHETDLAPAGAINGHGAERS